MNFVITYILSLSGHSCCAAICFGLLDSRIWKPKRVRKRTHRWHTGVWAKTQKRDTVFYTVRKVILH